MCLHPPSKAACAGPSPRRPCRTGSALSSAAEHFSWLPPAHAGAGAGPRARAGMLLDHPGPPGPAMSRRMVLEWKVSFDAAGQAPSVHPSCRREQGGGCAGGGGAPVPTLGSAAPKGEGPQGWGHGEGCGCGHAAQQRHRHSHTRSDPARRLSHLHTRLSGATWEPRWRCWGSRCVPAPSPPSAGFLTGSSPRAAPAPVEGSFQLASPRCRGDLPSRGAATGGVPFPSSWGQEGLDLTQRPLTPGSQPCRARWPISGEEAKSAGFEPKAKAAAPPDSAWSLPGLVVPCHQPGAGTLCVTSTGWLRPGLGPVGYGDRVTGWTDPRCPHVPHSHGGNIVKREVTRGSHERGPKSWVGSWADRVALEGGTGGPQMPWGGP